MSWFVTFLGAMFLTCGILGALRDAHERIPNLIIAGVGLLLLLSLTGSWVDFA